MKKLIPIAASGLTILSLIFVSCAPIIQIKEVLVQPNVNVLEKNAWDEMKELVKYYEGFYSNPYSCPAGFKTIGYGFTDKKLVSQSAISKKESSLILENKLRKIEKQVEQIVHVKLSPYQKCALISFTYNCDVDNLKKLVSGPGRLNDGNYESVEKLLLMYTKGGGKTLKGLVLRRNSEIKLWKKG
jgi:lysozyme